LKTGIFSEENKRHRPKKIAWPDLATLQAMVTEMPMLEIGRRLSVSDNAVRKHMRKEMKKV
jgi:predicted ArsR family transcriptional regulator